jgi:hypothetical protein
MGERETLYVAESYVNATEGHRIGESEPYEAWTADPGKLFRSCRAEFGRCIGKVYVDTDEGPTAVGWVFQARDKYQDADETYLREVWVTLHDAPKEVTTTYTYHALA